MRLHDVKEVVRSILRNEPKTRDDDTLLILKVWAKFEPQLRDPQYRFVAFSHLLLNGELPPPESIRRTRQKLQQHDKTLWGEKRKNRKDHSESIKEELKDPSFKPGGTP